MDRKAFLSALGLSGGAVFVASCLGACSKATADYGTASAPAVDFTLDLSLPANAALNNPGGYLFANGVIIAKTMAGNIIAVSQACTHQGVTVRYESNNNDFYCPSHGATFSSTGAVTGGPASSPLKQYTTTLTGNVLIVKG